MAFRPSLWDDSDPYYAPGLLTNRKRGTFHWASPKKYRDAGYSIKTVRLEGEPGDDLDLERARMCRELTREMVRWYEGETKCPVPSP